MQLKQARTTAKPSDYLSEGLISCTTDFQTTDVKSRADVRAVKRFRRRSEASVTSNPVSVYGILGIMKNTTCSLSTAVIAVAIALTGLANAQDQCNITPIVNATVDKVYVQNYVDMQFGYERTVYVLNKNGYGCVIEVTGKNADFTPGQQVSLQPQSGNGRVLVTRIVPHSERTFQMHILSMQVSK